MNLTSLYLTVALAAALTAAGAQAFRLPTTMWSLAIAMSVTALLIGVLTDATLAPEPFTATYTVTEARS